MRRCQLHMTRAHSSGRSRCKAGGARLAASITDGVGGAWQGVLMTQATVRKSSRPRAGRRFAPTHELALLGPARQACFALPGAHRGLLIVEELAGPIGIPDLTALVGSPGLLLDRLALDVPPLLNEIDAGVVAVAHPSAARSRATLAQALRWPVDTVSRRVPGLVRIGALLEVQPDRYVRPAALGPLGRIYAVEAKVRDWGAAVHQARSYGVWADSYVLVLGPLTARPLAQVRDEVEVDQGGLIVDGRWLRRPVLQRLAAARRVWAAEHLVAAVRDPVHQPSVAP
jgi:hypothetical protein